MLPQSCPLESCPISPKGDIGTKTAGPVLCRGEREPAKAGSPSPSQQCDETDRVTDPRVFTLAKTKKPLMPCHPARAREFLAKGRAVVAEFLPFAIRLKDKRAGITQPIQLKIDPGAKTTGVALTTTIRILTLIEISHRKAAIQKKLAQRRAYRRRRRSANLRCRQPRFKNRGKAGFIAPSIRSILDNVNSWVTQLRRWAPVTEIAIETTKFDAQKLQNPEIAGTEYQRGTLAGFEVWEYLLQKFNHRCAYCERTDLPLTQDHVIPRSAGGSNRVSNLTPACLPCNQSKGNQSVSEFLANRPEKLKALTAQLKKPLASCATMNTLRNKLVAMAEATGLPVVQSSGAQTKFNRKRFGIQKTHALDAAFTGDMAACPKGTATRTLSIKATGRGSYCRTRTDAFGFPRLYLPRTKMVRGFQTGDIVLTPKGVGRIAVRTKGHFALATAREKTTINPNHCRLAQRADGYNCQFLPTLSDGVSLASI
jgi:5-methylcytosine-specific restriction endonuclease McrA